MNADKLDTNAYGLMLEELLQRLKQEIDSHFDINTAPTDSGIGPVYTEKSTASIMRVFSSTTCPNLNSAGMLKPGNC